jgi:site-specific recombinase XerD
VATVDKRHLEGFLSSMDARGLSSSYRGQTVAAIRSFFAFLEDRGHTSLSAKANKLIPA